MTKNDIIRKLTEQTDLTASQATHAVDGIVSIISDALVADEQIFIRGFATIKTSRHEARVAHNFATGAAIQVPPRRQVKFQACKELKARINDNAHQ